MIQYRHIKSVVDVVVAASILILVSPLLFLIALTIKLDSPGPIFLRQKRWGKDRTVFECLKFRTMTVDAPLEVATRKLKDSAKYITWSGKFLRRSGLDELPQLINVLRGEMSLIGPRPVVLTETDLIEEREKYGANACLPGIGGWAQSNGRDEVSTKEKARLDGEYVQHFGFKMDVSCMWRTAVAIFTSKGFKEGHFGDNNYRAWVKKTTRKLPLPQRVYRKLRSLTEKNPEKSSAREARTKMRKARSAD